MKRGLVLQVQDYRGIWNTVAEEQVEAYLKKCIAYQQMTRKTVTALLLEGKELKYGTDWYDECRIPSQQPQLPPVELVNCKCGHAVRRALVMTTLSGTACPECYDRIAR